MIDVCWRQVLHLLLGDAQPDAIVDPRHGHGRFKIVIAVCAGCSWLT
jgi:hypothetical protein